MSVKRLSTRCKKCDAVYSLAKYKKNPTGHYEQTRRYIEKYPDRQATRLLVSNALKHKILIKSACRDCEVKFMHIILIGISH